MNHFDALEGISVCQLNQIHDLIKRKPVESLDANGLYTLCFQLLKIGGLQAEIPRLVVLGQQSMGKTTLLDFIMGGPVGYSSTDTGTRQPVVIFLKPLSGPDSDIKLCRIGTETVALHELQSKMKQHMMTRDAISTEELEVEIPLAGCLESIFVDLPGIKDDQKHDAEITRYVVKQYVVNNPNDIYLMVKKSSDDPANWPWSLREFMLGLPPEGLGLCPKQTFVVGTRAKEFLLNEKNDVRTQQQLLERVEKRAMRDKKGQILPLFLLELFSLSIEEKETLSFKQRQDLMHQQLARGKAECLELLNHFDYTDAATHETLRHFLDSDAFRHQLGLRFQTKLKEQLVVVENRLTNKIQQSRHLLKEKQLQYSRHTSLSFRESIQLYLRLFFEIVAELVTGNYMILKLENHGKDFLNTYGGTLQDNLQEGEKLALELFSKQAYPPYFLNHLTNKAQQILAQRQSKSYDTSDIHKTTPNDLVAMNEEDQSFVSDEPQPNIQKGIQLGQYIRFWIPKDRTHMMGHLHSFVISSTSNEKNHSNSRINEQLVNVAFYNVPNQVESCHEDTDTFPMTHQLKPLDMKRVQLIYPLKNLLKFRPMYPPDNFRCWLRYVRADLWVGLKPVMLRYLDHDSSSAALPWRFTTCDGRVPQNGALSSNIETKKVHYLELSHEGEHLDGACLNPDATKTCTLDQLYCDEASICLDTPYLYKEQFFTSHFTVYQQIAGEFADMKLLNEQSLTQLARWFRFHIALLEPEKQFSHSVLVQLMRSVKHVVDKADWEPLVADILHANIRDGLLQLSRLAACAAAVALRRVFRAALEELQRRVMSSSDIETPLILLCKSPSFIQSLTTALENFARERAVDCCHTMMELILELTHTIHFDMVEEIFQSCQRFEEEFLRTYAMKDITIRIREDLLIRKKLLAKETIHSTQCLATSQTLLHDEVKVQFWIMKMLLSAPLTIKLYMYFIKDIKDRSLHLGSEGERSCVVGNLEEQLQSYLLLKQADDKALLTPFTNEELGSRYDLGLHQKHFEEQIPKIHHVIEYLEITLQVVIKLRALISDNHQVHFPTAF